MTTPHPPDSSTAKPSPPVEPTPDTADDRYALWLRVREAIQTLPLYFDSKTNIEGIEAGDLFSLNSVLGSSIEVQVVTALNRIRDTWDVPMPGSTVGKYAQYGFVRMPQSYPDVRLQRAGDPSDVLLGLELKGWYLLSKEREPSYRFKATPLAASEWDLVVVVPWYLQNVLSGRPAVLEPFVKPARWAAEYRNWHWEWERGNPKKRPQETRGVRSPEGVTPPPPYPAGKTEMSDVPIEDAGDNFGRLSRAGVMDDYIERLLDANISGIAARDWIAFFTIFTESSTREAITRELRRIELSDRGRLHADPAADRAVALVRELLSAVRAADWDEEADEEVVQDTARQSVEAQREGLESAIRAAVALGLEAKDIAKVAGMTARAVEKLADASGSADAPSADDDGPSPDDSIPGPMAGEIGG